MLPPTAKVVCVYFNADAAECEKRVAGRTDHPTIPYGRGRAAVKSMSRALEPPVASEGYASVLTVSSFEESNQLLRRWGAGPAESAAPGLFKFPRTHHVVNTGGTSVSRDDLVLAASECAAFVVSGAEVIAEEKVDGANLGFSLSEDYTVQAQNRSHWVCSATQTQFKGLGAWLEENSWALCQILEPEVEVLFGEWLAVRHSVPYTRLPGYFLAFDIYDKRTGKFASVTERDRRLAGLGIPIVPTIARRRFASKDELLELLETRSAFYDGFIEGAYLRVDEPAEAGGLHNVSRGKIVRPDFMQNITTHWISHVPIKNGICR